MEKSLSVSQLNKYIRLTLENDEILQQVCVRGELSGVTLHRSGHIYLKLKDEQSVISCVMFRFNAEHLSFRPMDGQRVIVYGCVSVYEPGGSYQIKITAMQPDGTGDLAVQFEQLKKKLANLGLFDAEHKKKLPPFPKTIGVITSPTGAAIRDIIKVCGRRYPQAEILLYPALVQGTQAAEQLTEAVQWFDANRAADVLIIGRGGGSMEDLWCFNDEQLVFAVYNCEIPIVSAVGHEIDFTLCDFAADVRAATPSMAAELVCPDSAAFGEQISLLQKRLADLLAQKAQRAQGRLTAARQNRVFRDPTYLFGTPLMKTEQLEKRLQSAAQKAIDDRAAQFEKTTAKLEALSPLATLLRGYAAVTDEQGRTMRGFDSSDVGKKVSVRLGKSRASCLVEQVEEENSWKK